MFCLSGSLKDRLAACYLLGDTGKQSLTVFPYQEGRIDVDGIQRKVSEEG